MPLFDSIEELPGDPILGIVTAFKEDSRSNKTNLAVGAYRDSEGKPVLLTTVEKAERRLLENRQAKNYLPIDGAEAYIKASQKLIFGEDSSALKAGKIFGAQSVGGTSALRTGGEFIAKHIGSQVYISDPSWPNHKPIFESCGLSTQSYPYYNPIQNQIEFEKMCEAIKSMPPKSVIVFHGCCHNPCGMDPTLDQWKTLSELCKMHKIIPFFDIAYQGFDQDPEKDVAGIRYFVEEGHEMLVASSYSKNFGLYGERVGLLSIVTDSAETEKKIRSQVKKLIRSNYSNPPTHGQQIVTTILNSSDLKEEWLHELSNMRLRIQEMRKGLVAGLLAKGTDADFDFIHRQTGMFSLTGLTPDQVLHLRKEFGIYMPKNGRINIAGLNWNNLDYVIDAITSVHEK